ncbi:MAG TPA: NAD-dependent epimerase/dehydratase family protein [Bacteroidales bacterium]|nr:NAD-dependent epimerase/dehydratase family protein [Bacteroidales bacterium]
MTTPILQDLPIKRPAILLTGGSGFLGRTIIRELLSSDSILDPKLIRVFDRNDFPGEKDPRLKFIPGDICNYSKIKEACQGIDIVIHSAAIVDWGTQPAETVFAVNVDGTRNVIRACQENQVKFLVFTSSLDAIFGGKPLVNINEHISYPERHPNMYCRSKFLAEVLVTEANGCSLKTCVIRPADIYGEGDPFHIGSLVEMARGGFYIRIGNGNARSQHVYVGNVAHAHLHAVRQFLEGNQKMAGKIYFITDQPASNFFTFYDHIVRESGYRIWPKNLRIPYRLAYFLGALSEATAFILRPVKKYNPKFSRFAVTYTCTDFTFTADRAAADFGYRSRYSPEEALERTIRFYRTQKESVQ